MLKTPPSPGVARDTHSSPAHTPPPPPCSPTYECEADDPPPAAAAAAARSADTNTQPDAQQLLFPLFTVSSFSFPHIIIIVLLRRSYHTHAAAAATPPSCLYNTRTFILSGSAPLPQPPRSLAALDTAGFSSAQKQVTESKRLHSLYGLKP